MLGFPRVWSPLQGCAPWALKGVAPLGLLCMEGCLTQGLVALAGLRTLGFEWVAPLGLRKCGHGRTQGLVALIGLRTLGFERGRPAGAYPAARELPRNSTIGA